MSCIATAWQTSLLAQCKDVHFYHAMLCGTKHGIEMHAVGLCMSVRLSVLL